MIDDMTHSYQQMIDDINCMIQSPMSTDIQQTVYNGRTI